MPLLLRSFTATLRVAALTAAARAAAPLPALHIDRGAVTVSGVSSGAHMAVQLGYAHSATFSGVGVFAGGPYGCGRHDGFRACMFGNPIGAERLATLQADIDAWSGNSIDTKGDVAAQRIHLFIGEGDAIIGQGPMDALRRQYADNGVTRMAYVKLAGATHVFPTDFDAPGNSACSPATLPNIANCGHDGAKAVLTQFYGPLDPRNDTPAAANYIEFDQTPFSADNPGMAATGWVYVPTACAGGATPCRLHVALHGCSQNHAAIGDRFIKNTGYTRWADTNRIVVVFPQTRADPASRSTVANGSQPNPLGCWDWIGWYGEDFARKSGAQVRAIKAMVDRLASGGARAKSGP